MTLKLRPTLKGVSSGVKLWLVKTRVPHRFDFNLHIESISSISLVHHFLFPYACLSNEASGQPFLTATECKTEPRHSQVREAEGNFHHSPGPCFVLAWHSHQMACCVSVRILHAVPQPPATAHYPQNIDITETASRVLFPAERAAPGRSLCPCPHRRPSFAERIHADHLWELHSHLRALFKCARARLLQHKNKKKPNKNKITKMKQKPHAARL